LEFPPGTSPRPFAKSPKKFNREETSRVSEKMVLVGLLPEAISVDSGDQVVWYSNAGNLKIEFDPQRSPFNSNVFQAPPGVRLSSGTLKPGLNPGSYKYRLSLNDVFLAQAEVLVRGK
jgi:hypothetical protein